MLVFCRCEQGSGEPDPPGPLARSSLWPFILENGEFVHWYQQERVKCVARKTKEQLIFNLMSQNKALVETSELTATEIRKVLMFRLSCLPACKSFILDSEPDPRGWIKHEHMLSFSCGSLWISDCEKSTDSKLQGTQWFLRLDFFFCTLVQSSKGALLAQGWLACDLIYQQRVLVFHFALPPGNKKLTWVL